MGKISERQKGIYKIWTMAVLLAGTCISLYYFHVILGIDTIITHIFYVPIILASIWWKRKGLVVALFISGFLVLSHVFLRPDMAIHNDYFRAFMFIVTAIVVAELSRRIAKEHEALQAANQQLSADEQQLRAANQQLSADEQQLRAGNQQLRANEQQLVSEVAERKSAEERVREQREFLRNTIESLSYPFYVIDANDKTITMANSTAWQGKLPEKITCYMLSHKQNKPCSGADHPCPLEDIKKTKQPVTVEHVHYDKDGNPRNIEVHAYPIFDNEQNVTQIIEYCLDITERKKAEKALQLERDNFINILDSMEDGVYIADWNHDIQYVNPILKKDFGPYEERKCYEYFHDRKEICPWCKSEEVFAGKTVRWEWYSSKNQRTYDLIDTPLRNPDGSISKLEIFRDITEHKKAEEALQQSEERLKILFESAPDAIYLNDLKGNIVDGNKTAEEMTGYKREELIGKNVVESGLLSPEQVPEVITRLEKNAMDKPMGPDEFTLKRKDGSYVTVEVRAFPVRIGNQTLSLGIARDISDRKKAEEAVRKERDKAQKYLDVAGVVLMAIDVEGRVGLINKKGCEILGYKEEEIIGKNWFDNFLPERVRKEVKTVFKKLMAGNLEPVEYFENPILTKDGDERLIAWHNTILRTEQGEIIGTLSSGEDITERKEAEKTLITYQNDLRSLASKLTSIEEFQRRQIAADLHDHVSQTLALSVNQLRRLRKSTASGDAKTLDEVCRMIEKTMQNVQDLTFDLASPTLYKIGLEAAISELLNEQLRDRHGIACKFSDDKKDKPLDDNVRVLLFQAVRELLVNVIKHAKAHEVEVAIQRENDKIQISVSDDGVGFDIQEAETSIEQSGGFGLFNIRERIDYIDGRFEIHSQPGCGSRFILTVPIKNKINL